MFEFLLFLFAILTHVSCVVFQCKPTPISIMAFMAMRKNLDERHRKKNFDEIFKKFDHNHNQRVSIREFTEVEKYLR